MLLNKNIISYKTVLLICCSILIVRVTLASPNTNESTGVVIPSKIESSPTAASPKANVAPSNITSKTAIAESKVESGINSTVIKSIDQQVLEIDTLKRQLEAEKLQSEIKRSKSSGSGKINGSGNGGFDLSDSARTTVVYVFINKSGYRYASLQFIDGSVRDVEIGSRVGQYVVRKINMDGVTLVSNTCRKKTKCSKIILERAYPRDIIVTNALPQIGNGAAGASNNLNTYQPTPITGTNEESVPPIINIKL